VQLSGPELTPRFDTAGADPVSLVSASAGVGVDPTETVSVELDARSFDAARSLKLALPTLAPEAQALELRVELKLGGNVESPAETNDFFDWLPFRKKKVQSTKLLELRFKSDHRVLHANSADLGPVGPILTKPEWRLLGGKPSLPISHSKAKTLDVTIDLEVLPPNADEVVAEIVGKAAFGAEFRVANFKLKGGVTSIDLSSIKPLQDEMNKLVGNIEWSVKIDGQVFPAGASVGHVIYLTLGTPFDDPTSREAGISVKRLDESVRLFRETGVVAVGGKLDTQEMVQQLRKKSFPAFTLDIDDTVNKDFNHPNFFNAVGGAWRILETADKLAHCQALVRLVLAMCQIVGMPGRFETLAAFVDPVTGVSTSEPLGDGTLAGLEKASEQAKVKAPSRPFLTSKEPGRAPRTFALSDAGAPDLNVYEACMKFTDPAGRVVFHPGGGGDQIHGDIDNVVRGSFEALILATLLFDPTKPLPADPKARLDRIVKRFVAPDLFILPSL
jgi:hypothetical protein